jgi:hypothetical protein
MGAAVGTCYSSRAHRPCSIREDQIKACNDPSINKFEPPLITVFTLNKRHLNSGHHVRKIVALAEIPRRRGSGVCHRGCHETPRGLRLQRQHPGKPRQKATGAGGAGLTRRTDLLELIVEAPDLPRRCDDKTPNPLDADLRISASPSWRNTTDDLRLKPLMTP